MFGLTTRKKAIQAFAPYIKALQQYTINQALSSTFVVYGFNKSGDQLDAYASIDDLYSIVRKIAKTCKMVPLYVYEIKDEKEFGKYRIMQRKAHHAGYGNKYIYDIRELQHKSMEIVGESDPLQKILDNPNEWQSRDEFYEAAYSFTLLTGNDYIRLNVLKEGGNEGKLYGPNAMWHLPPNYTFPVPGDTPPRKPVGYKFTLYGAQEDIPLEEMIHRKYWNSHYDYGGSELVGLSPWQPGAKTLTQVGNERDYANRSLINSGAGGVLIGDAPEGMTDEAAGRMMDAALRELGPAFRNGSNINANKLAGLFGKWAYEKITIDPANMQLIEQTKMTFKKMCNNVGISDQLFNNDDGGKYDNRRLMIQELYTNAALPEVYSLRDGFNQKLTPRYNVGRYRKTIECDLSDISELQENANEIAQRYGNSPVIIPQQYFEAMGWGTLDPKEHPGVDQVFMKQGYSLLADMATPVNIDLTGVNDYAGNS